MERACPKCGTHERSIFMTTGADNPEDNKATCPACGWKGKVVDLVSRDGKPNDQRKAELDAREKDLDKREAALNDPKPPRSLGEIVTDIMPYLSEEGQVYLSENDSAWKDGQVPEGLAVEDTATDDIEKMSKKKLIEALTALGAKFDPKAKREDLLVVFKAEYAKQNANDAEQPTA